MVRRHYGAVYGLLRSLGADDADAEDALQECFVSAWRNAPSFRGGESARPWLFAIARNALRRLHRRRAGEPARTESLDSLAVGAGWGQPARATARFEAAEEIRWALAHLPEGEREVVVMRDLLGVEGKETAQALGLSLAAMKSRLHRGRLRLMSLLRGGEVDDG